MLRLEETHLQLERTLGEQLAEAIGSGPIRLGSGEPAIGRVLNLRAIPHLTHLEWAEGQARARGVIDLILLYERAARRSPSPGTGTAGGEGKAGGWEEAGARGEQEAEHHHFGYSDEDMGEYRGAEDETEAPAATRPRIESTVWREALAFETWADLPGADLEPPAELEGSCEIEQVAFRVDEDGLGLEAEVSLAVAVRSLRVEPVRLITGMNAGARGRVRLEGERVVLEDFVGRSRAETTVRGEAALAAVQGPARRVVDVEVQPVVRSARAARGAVEAEGQVRLDLLYMAGPAGTTETGTDLTVSYSGPENGDEMPVHEAIELSWRANIPLPEAREGLATRVTAQVAGVRVNLAEDGRAVQASVVLALEARAVHRIPTTLLVAATGETIEVATQNQPFQAESFVGESEGTGAAVGELELGDELEGISRVLTGSGRVHVDRITCAQDRVEVEGAVDLVLLYQAGNREQSVETASFPRAVTFLEQVVVAGARPEDVAQVQVEMGAIEVSPRGSRYALARVPLRLRAKVTRPLEASVVTDAVEVIPVAGEPPTMRYVFVQPGDTLWRLATRYSTTPELLLEVTPGLPEGELPVGRKIFIPRRIVKV